MFELIFVLGTVAVAGLAIFLVVSLGVLAVKLLFKLLLLPFVLGMWLVKGILAVLGVVLAIVLAPLVIGVLAAVVLPLLLLALPFILLAGLFGLGAAAVSAA